MIDLDAAEEKLIEEIAEQLAMASGVSMQKALNTIKDCLCPVEGRITVKKTIGILVKSTKRPPHPAPSHNRYARIK